MSRAMRPAWTADKLREQGLTTTVEVAAEVLGISRGAAYDSIRRDTFPVPVIKVSRRRWVVPTAHLLRVLGLTEDAERHVRIAWRRAEVSR